MVAVSFAASGVRSQWTIIGLVVAAGVIVSVPAGVVTGVLSGAAETELQHGGVAGVLGTIAGLVLLGSVESAMAPLSGLAYKLDILYLTMTWGLGTFVFVFPFIFGSAAYVSRYVANVRWQYTNETESDWGDKGRYDQEEAEWGSNRR
jgi:hypothetical protein